MGDELKCDHGRYIRNHYSDCPLCSERERKSVQEWDDWERPRQEEWQRRRDEDLRREAEARRSAEMVLCPSCGQMFGASTAVRLHVGKKWVGVLARHADESICPKCHKDYGHAEVDWSLEEWRAHQRKRVARCATVAEAQSLAGELAGQWPELVPEANARVLTLERDEREQRRRDLQRRIETENDPGALAALAHQATLHWPDLVALARTRESLRRREIEAQRREEMTVRLAAARTSEELAQLGSQCLDAGWDDLARAAVGRGEILMQHKGKAAQERRYAALSASIEQARTSDQARALVAAAESENRPDLASRAARRADELLQAERQERRQHVEFLLGRSRTRHDFEDVIALARKDGWDDIARRAELRAGIHDRDARRAALTKRAVGVLGCLAAGAGGAVRGVLVSASLAAAAWLLVDDSLIWPVFFIATLVGSLAYMIERARNPPTTWDDVDPAPFEMSPWRIATVAGVVVGLFGFGAFVTRSAVDSFLRDHTISPLGMGLDEVHDLGWTWAWSGHGVDATSCRAVFFTAVCRGFGSCEGHQSYGESVEGLTWCRPKRT